jgi:hypothetical protein
VWASSFSEEADRVELSMDSSPMSVFRTAGLANAQSFRDVVTLLSVSLVFLAVLRGLLEVCLRVLVSRVLMIAPHTYHGGTLQADPGFAAVVGWTADG